MKEIELKNGKRVEIIISVSCLIFALLVLITPLQNMIFYSFENFILHRALTRSVWIERFHSWSKEFLIFAVMPIFSIFFQKIPNAKIKKIIVISASFAFLFFLHVYKLTNSSLWFDEGIEYWYSKILTGSVPFNSTSNMYERIVSTLQPPLFNVLMYVWLKIFDSEFMLRFLGVVVSMAGLVGFFLTVREFSNYKFATLMTLFYGSSRTFISYTQEVAEYYCMISFVTWMIYFWTKAAKNFSIKNLSLYFFFATLAIYSQYGAFMIIAGTALILFANIFVKENSITVKQKAKYFSLSAATTILVAIIPLIYFFAIKQASSSRGTVSLHSLNFLNGNIIYDMTINYRNCFTFYFGIFFIPNKFFSVALILFTFFVLVRNFIKQKNIFITSGFTLTWLIYYFAVSFNFYANPYGEGFSNFASRWGLFAMPLFAVFYSQSAYEFYNFVKSNIKSTDKQIIIKKIAFYMILFLITLNSISIFPNWQKSGIRDLYNDLAKNLQTDDIVLMEYWWSPTFYFYATHDKNFNTDNLQNLKVLNRYRSEHEIRQAISELLSNDLPKKFYLIADIDDDILEIIKKVIFEQYDAILEKPYSDCVLFLFERKRK